MFNNDRFLTANLTNEISIELQKFLWSLIEEKKSNNIPLDYLQVFNLYKLNNKIMIVHSQEIPHFRETHILKGKLKSYFKIFCIDNGEYTTMMLATDY